MADSFSTPALASASSDAMRAFAILVCMSLAGAAAIVLTIHNWTGEVIVLLADDKHILDEAAAEHNGRGHELIVGNDRKLVDLLQHKPFGWPLTPAQRDTLTHTQERLADYEATHPGASAVTTPAANVGPVALATPQPAIPREQRDAASGQREALDIARKYGAPR